MEKKMNRPIDFVIIWVDGNDPEWQKEKKKYNEDIRYNINNVRYRDMDNLQYWFRGVEKFAPWVNKIHFVTYGHLPKWLNTKHPKLNIVKHSDYIPKKYLPTFSANPIELNLHRIKGLEEQFVFFNDDMFLISPTKENDFFKNGLPCDSAIMDIQISEPYGTGNILSNDIETINKYFNKKQILKKYWKKWFNLKYGKFIIRTICLSIFKNLSCFTEFHIPTSFMKKTYETVWEKEAILLDEVSHNKFRNKADVNQWLMRDWQLCTGEFYPRSTKTGKLLSLKDVNSIKNAILKQKYKMICINDSRKLNIEEFEERKKQVNRAFQTILNEKSDFEK